VDYTVFGLQRSGTNFLETLIKKSFKDTNLLLAYEHNGVWKHAFDIQHDIKTQKARVKYNDDGKVVHFRSNGSYVVETYDYWINRLRSINAILITKHPFTWIESVQKKNVDMRRFKKYNASHKSEMFAEIYHDHALFWKEQMRYQNILHIKYEDLLVSRELWLNKISEHFNDECTPFTGELTKISMSPSFSADDVNRYRNIETKLSTEEKNNVLGIIGEDIMKMYRYEN